MYKLIRSILFLLPPERAHYFTLYSLQILFIIPGLKYIFKAIYRRKSSKPTELFGLSFPNKIGLAAGFDKDARFLHELEALGFGFIEIGTLTPKGQPGNPQPRLFRLKRDNALINRLGFNNQGVNAAITRLKNRPEGLIVGGNIGKNKVTPNEEAYKDYLSCFVALHPYVDYFTVNVSSPNTPGLRELQGKDALLEILSSLVKQNRSSENPKPILLKIAPDLTEGQIDDIADISRTSGIDGLIATNTTISRAGLKTSEAAVVGIGPGGLSGAPVFEHSTEVLQKLREKIGPNFPIIGVGGIMDVKSGQAKLDAGANLIQVYTGFIYGGPKLIRDLGKL